MSVFPERITRNQREYVLHVLVLLFGWTFLTQALHRDWALRVQYSYGFAMPLLSAFLFLRRWEDRPSPSSTFPVKGISLWMWPVVLGLVFALMLVTEANPDWRMAQWARALLVVTVWSAWLVQTGGLAWGRHFAFPLGFTFLAVPWPSLLERAMVENFSTMVTACAVEALNLLGSPALRHGNVIELANGFVGVDEACSGVRSFQATLMVSLFLGEMRRLKAQDRAWLLLGGLGFSLLGNILRAGVLARVAAEAGGVVMESWHDRTGEVALVLVLGAVAWLGFSFREQPVILKIHPQRNYSRPALRNVLGMVLVLVLSWLGTEGWFAIHSAKNTESVSWRVEWPLREPGWKSRPLPATVRDILQFDEASAALGSTPEGYAWNVFYARWKPGSAAGPLARSHPPDLCLPAGGRRLMRRGAEVLVQVSGLRVPLRSFEFQEDSGRALWVFHCLWEDGSGPVVVDSSAWTVTSSMRWQAAWQGRRNAGQRLILLALAGPGNLEQAAEIVQQHLPGWLHPD